MISILRNLIFWSSLLISFKSSILDWSPRRFVVWNVGQGLATTYRNSDDCWHFDWGGERNPNHEMLLFCRNQDHRFMISHWDWDHYSFLKPLMSRSSKHRCLRWESSSALRPKWIQPHHFCSLSSDPPFVQIYSGREGTKNESSRVVRLKDFLLPGDSPSSTETGWRKSELHQIRVLILAHHGSKDANGERAIRLMPRLRMAVASARRAKYGHPHFEIKRRLQKFGVALIQTEIWGNLIFEIKESRP